MSKEHSSKKTTHSYSLLQKKVVQTSKPKKSEKVESKTASAADSKGKDDLDHDEPDRSYGDYYCKICDSHMNSENMWEMHVGGKRHLKNVKKGDPDTKYEDLDVESDVKYELMNVKDTIVGLSHIEEIRREPGVPAVYKCFLCNASIATCELVIEHVITLKHRLNYIKEVSPDQYYLLNATNLKKGSLEPLVLETAAKLESEYGKGSVRVRQEKAKVGSGTYKRSYNDSDDEYDVSQKTNKKISKEDPYVWKSVPKDGRDFDNAVRREMLDKRGDSSSGVRGYSPMKEFRKSHRSDHSPESEKYKRSDYSRRLESDSSYHPSDLGNLGYRGASPHYDNYHSRKDDYSHKMSSSQHYGDARPGYSSENRSSYDVPLPQDKSTKVDSVADRYKEFLRTFNDLPAKTFLNLVLCKLEFLSMTNVEDLQLATKVINKLQNTMCNQLPPELKLLLKEKIQNSDTVVKTSTPATVPERNSAMTMPNFTEQYKTKMNEIDNLIYAARRQSSASNSAQPSAYPDNYSPYTNQQNFRSTLPAPLNPPSFLQPTSGLPPNNSTYSHNSAAPQNQPNSSIPGLTLTDKPFSLQNTWPASSNNQPYGGYRY